MEASQQMIAEEGQDIEVEANSQPFDIRRLESNKVLTYKVTKWDRKPQNWHLLLQLQQIISEQLPLLPSEYINKILSDWNHISIIMLLNGYVIGGTCFRLFKNQSLAQLVFFAVEQSQQSKGFGKRLMEILKDFLKNQQIKNILTFADDTARIFFKKQGFSKDITLPKSIWQGLVKEYSGSKIMQCKVSLTMNYLNAKEFIEQQRKQIDKQIQTICLQKIFPKKSEISLIKLKKSFLDPLPNVPLSKLIKRLPGFKEYEEPLEDSKLNQTEFKVSIQEECKDLMYDILNQSETSKFQFDKYFYEKIPDSQNPFKGVNFPIIYKKMQNNEYLSLTQFIEDLNSFIILIEHKYTEGEKKASARRLGKFIHSKIDNLRYLEEVLSAKDNSVNKIQQEKPAQINM